MTGPRQRVVYFLSSQIAFAVLQGLVLVAVARLGGAEDVGLYSLALALTSPVFLLAHARLQDVAASDAEVKTHMTTYLLHVLAAGGLAIIACLGLSAWWGGFQLAGTVAFLSVAKFAELLSLLSYGNLQGSGRVVEISNSMLARGSLALIGVVLGYELGGLTTAIAGMAVAWVGWACASDLRHLGLRIEGRAPRLGHGVDFRLMAALLPLGLGAMFLSLNQTSVRLILESEVGVVELGVFAAAAYSVRLGVVISRGVMQLSAPALRAAAGKGDSALIWRVCWQSSVWVGLFAFGYGTVVAALGPSLFPLLFGPSFMIERALLLVIGGAGLFLYLGTTLSRGIIASGRHRLHLLFVVASVTVTTSAALALTHSYGMTGAALGWMFGEATRATLIAADLARRARGVA